MSKKSRKSKKPKPGEGSPYSIIDLHGQMMKEHENLLDASTVERISTGIPYVDRIISGEAIGGGVPLGGVIEISGPFSSGKTTLALTIMRRFLKHFSDDEGAMYFDYENSVDARYAKNAFGIDLDNSDPRVIYFQPSTIGDARRVLASMFKRARECGSCPVRLVVFDSIAAMNPEIALDTLIETGEVNKGLGLQARDLSVLFMQFIRLFKEYAVTLILCNQLRARIKLNPYDGGPDEETSGGNALKFYCWTRLTLKPAGSVKAKAWDAVTGEQKDRKLYSIIRVNTIKNKVGPPHIQDEIYIRYGYGVDNAYTTVVKAQKYGLYHPDSQPTQADKDRYKQPYITKEGGGAGTRYVLWRYEVGGIDPKTGKESDSYCQVEDKKNSSGKRIVKRTEMLSAQNPILLSEQLILPKNKGAWGYLLSEILLHYNRDSLFMTPSEKAVLAREVDGQVDADAIANEGTLGLDVALPVSSEKSDA